jgi:hypothetical protein
MPIEIYLLMSSHPLPSFCILVRVRISTAMSYDTRRWHSTQQEHVAVHVHALMSPIAPPPYSANIDRTTGTKRRDGAFTCA